MSNTLRFHRQPRRAIPRQDGRAPGRVPVAVRRFDEAPRPGTLRREWPRLAVVTDYAAFLRHHAAQQPPGIASHQLSGERLWLKRAGPRHSRFRYQLLALIARTLRLDVLTPVPNHGGEAAIATEARRLRALADAGLRVPRVLAQSPEGLLIADLGRPGRPCTMLHDRLEQAAADGPLALLAAWRQGLQAIADVHARGAYLSQAFARNLVHCPDGVIGFIDFEDDPGETLSLPECQTRDWLSYLHSTALLLSGCGADEVSEAWRAALAPADAAVQSRLALAATRMRWLRHLPTHRRWGRDTQRVRAVATLLGQWYPG